MMVPCLQAYIQKAPDMFLAGRAQLPEGNIPYIDLIISMVAKTVTNERSSESECRHALSLFMGVLHNCQGKVDGYISTINEIILGKLGQIVNSDVILTRISIYQVLGSALYYNPQLELAELEKREVTQQVFQKWMEDAATKDMSDRWLPRKISILGLSSILLIPAASLPAPIQSSLPALIDFMIRTTIALKTEAEGGAKETENDNNADQGFGDDEDVGDVDQGFGEDEDVTNEVDESYRKALQGVTSWDDDMAKFLLGGDWDDSEDIDEDFTSPLDRVDELLFLNDTLKGAFGREPEAYQQVQAAMSPESVANCQQVFQAADQMRAQAAQQSTQQS
mmetsp:Transcript_6964/g.17011  ORF Transcript_6964/g.17011 Transcript_6964/m.17011 type:complete len:336 (+) Transcript_6964:70-1077(+)